MNDEIVDEFVIESLEHFREVGPLLLQMEELGTAELDDLNSIFRALHSLEGAAGGDPSSPEPAGTEGVIHLEHALLQLLETRSLLSPQVSGAA